MKKRKKKHEKKKKHQRKEIEVEKWKEIVKNERRMRVMFF